MPDSIQQAVKKAATTGDVAALRALVASHGAAAVRLDDDPARAWRLEIEMGHEEIPKAQ